MDVEQAHWPAMSLDEATARLTAPGARFELADSLIRGIPMKVWKNAPATARQLFDQIRGHDARECLVFEDERITYDGFCRAVLTLAAALQARGVKKGDRVSLVMRNLPEWPVAFLAGLMTGAILVPLNARWTAAELGFALSDCGAALAICDGERLAAVRAAAPGLEILAARAAPDSGITRLEDILGARADWSRLPATEIGDVALEPEDDATIFYTSGTTGAPKGALGTHRNLTTNVFATPFSSARNALRTGQGLEPKPRAILIVIPLFHVSACMASLLPSLAAGGKIVLMRKFSADAALALMERERITIAGGVPAIALTLLDGAHGSYDLSALELLSYGGAPSPARLAGRIAQAFAHVWPGNAWGMTETSATHTIHSGRDYLARPQSCGPALPVGAIKVMRDGVDAPPGAVGDLWAFGPNIVKGYWNRPEATAETFVDGWVRTGDLARIDQEGFCTIMDRARDMIIRGGENIYCVEVEQVLAAHPGVADAALVGLADPYLGEIPAAVVQARARLDVDELRAFAAERLASFKLPVRLLVSDAPLPRNEGGKLMKDRLKAMFAP